MTRNVTAVRTAILPETVKVTVQCHFPKGYWQLESDEEWTEVLPLERAVDEIRRKVSWFESLCEDGLEDELAWSISVEEVLYLARYTEKAGFLVRTERFGNWLAASWWLNHEIREEVRRDIDGNLCQSIDEVTIPWLRGGVEQVLDNIPPF